MQSIDWRRDGTCAFVPAQSGSTVPMSIESSIEERFRRKEISLIEYKELMAEEKARKIKPQK